jgi:hypothetical protein
MDDHILIQKRTSKNDSFDSDAGGRRNGDDPPVQQQGFGCKQRRCHDGGQDMRVTESS